MINKLGTKFVVKQLMPELDVLEDYLKNIELSPVKPVTDNTLYTGFLQLIARTLVPYRHYKNKLTGFHEVTWDKLLTTDDEAFAWLVLENCMVRWNKEYTLRKRLLESDEEQKAKGFFKVTIPSEKRRALPQTRFTQTTVNDKKVLCGWTDVGMNRFLEIKKNFENFKEDYEATGIIEDIGNVAVTNMKEEVAAQEEAAAQNKSGYQKSEKEQEKKRKLEKVYRNKNLSKFANAKERRMLRANV